MLLNYIQSFVGACIRSSYYTCHRKPNNFHFTSVYCQKIALVKSFSEDVENMNPPLSSRTCCLFLYYAVSSCGFTCSYGSLMVYSIFLFVPGCVWHCHNQVIKDTTQSKPCTIILTISHVQRAERFCWASGETRTYNQSNFQPGPIGPR